jgi:hypothetical protein
MPKTVPIGPALASLSRPRRYLSATRLRRLAISFALLIIPSLVLS